MRHGDRGDGRDRDLFLSGICGLFLAFEAFTVTESIALALLLAAVGVLIMVAAISEFAA